MKYFLWLHVHISEHRKTDCAWHVKAQDLEVLALNYTYTLWFKLYFNCFNYKNTYKKNMIYPGSDIKPEACTKVISWQHDKQIMWMVREFNRKHVQMSEVQWTYTRSNTGRDRERQRQRDGILKHCQLQHTILYGAFFDIQSYQTKRLDLIINSCTLKNKASFSKSVADSLPYNISRVVWLYFCRYVSLIAAYLGRWKRKWYRLSKEPHSHDGVGTIFLRYKCELRELHSMRNRACKIWPIPDPALKYFRYICLFLFRRHLKEVAVLAFLMSSDRLFQALMVDGRKELKKRLVRVRIDWMLSELRKL